VWFLGLGEAPGIGAGSPGILVRAASSAEIPARLLAILEYMQHALGAIEAMDARDIHDDLGRTGTPDLLCTSGP